MPAPGSVRVGPGAPVGPPGGGRPPWGGLSVPKLNVEGPVPCGGVGGEVVGWPARAGGPRGRLGFRPAEFTRGNRRVAVGLSRVGCSCLRSGRGRCEVCRAVGEVGPGLTPWGGRGWRGPWT